MKILILFLEDEEPRGHEEVLYFHYKIDDKIFIVRLTHIIFILIKEEELNKILNLDHKHELNDLGLYVIQVVFINQNLYPINEDVMFEKQQQVDY